MSYITKGMNFMLESSYSTGGETQGGVSNASIRYYPPEGVTIDHFRVKLFNNMVHTTIYAVNRIRGKFRQYNSAGNLLSETDIEITRGNSVTISASSGVDNVELFITYYETINLYSGGAGVYVDTISNGTGNEIIRIATEDSANNETSSVRLTSYKIISTAKDNETVQVTGEQPTRVFNVTTTNTGPYIRQWAVEIVSITGSANPDVDKVYFQLLDMNDNILASTNIGVAVGNVAFLDHNTNTKKIRVYLSTTKRLIVVCKVHELIDIAYGVP